MIRTLMVSREENGFAPFGVELKKGQLSLDLPLGFANLVHCSGQSRMMHGCSAVIFFKPVRLSLPSVR